MSEQHSKKQQIVILTTMLFTGIASAMVFLYNPSELHLRTIPPTTEAVIPKITESIGAPQVLKREDDTIKKPTVNERNLQLPSMQPQLPSGFYNNLPPSIPISPPKNSEQKPKLDTTPVYARHVSITDAMNNGLSEKFKLETMTVNSQNANRFNTSYVITEDSETTERFDLMSIAKTENLRAIKTAKDALKSLVEESDSVNILDYDDNSLLYEIAGEKGYQVGKIITDDVGIYIIGYVNFTTNSMPSIIRQIWIDKMKDIN